MISVASSQPSHRLIPFRTALFIVLLMAVLITLVDTLQPPEPTLSLLGFIPGIIGLLALGTAGQTRADCYLRFAGISRLGAGVLVAMLILLPVILGTNSAWTGWQWVPALVIAPASGISQELYFRSSLLPALERALGGRRTAALLLHSVIFVGYHFRTFRSLPSLPVAVLVAAVLFSAGCGWGWQVQRDRTVVWAMVQHSLFLMLMSMFDWG